MPRVEKSHLQYDEKRSKTKVQIMLKVRLVMLGTVIFLVTKHRGSKQICSIEKKDSGGIMTKVLIVLYLGVLSFFDVREKKVPISILKIGFVSGVIMAFINCFLNQERWGWVVVAAMLGMLPGIAISVVAVVSGKIGLGDGIVLVSMGMVLGYKESFLLLCISLFVMSVWSVFLLASGKGKRNTRIPYMPFLLIAYLAVCLLGT